MKIERLLPVIFLLFLSGKAFCQDSDFGLWYEVNTEKALSKKFEIDGTIQVRTFKNGSIIEQAYAEVGVTYNLNKYLGFAGSYRIGNYLDKDYLYYIRHKWFADIKGSLPAGNFNFSLRLRLQLMARINKAEESDNTDEYDGRAKFKVMYKIPHFPVDPYISFETFSPLFSNSDYLVEKSRTTAGIQWKITKKHIIEAEYINQRDKTPHLSILNIASVSYTFKF
jgi:hypothetical protein